MSIFEQLKNSEEYKRILSKMSDEEKSLAEDGIKKLVEHFENTVIGPLEKLKDK